MNWADQPTIGAKNQALNAATIMYIFTFVSIFIVQHIVRKYLAGFKKQTLGGGRPSGIHAASLTSHWIHALWLLLDSDLHVLTVHKLVSN